MLPEQFLSRMKSVLGGDFEDFLASYEKPECRSLRVNFLKGSAQEFEKQTSFRLRPVPWAEGGFYYEGEERPGKHPFHDAGVYYIQEASAMAPASYLKAEPGERVLDLCAAPGGKSTQIAADMQGEGLLICNEIHPARAKILSENVERMGIRNAIVVSHEPSVLSERFEGFFDRILVDAPCSGEGMFRRNPEAVKEWSPENVDLCARRQEKILECASSMLREGGRLVYSTCTFEYMENEDVIRAFEGRHPEFHLCDLLRLWPHEVEGEGHFLACLEKENQGQRKNVRDKGERGLPEKDCREWTDFRDQYLEIDFSGVYLRFGDQLYLSPEKTPSLKGLKALRPGLHLGTVKKGRFEPSHALALSLKPGQTKYQLNLSLSEAERYLRGETLTAAGEKGWYLIAVEGYSLGWGKLSGGIMKNHYPRGLRK